MKIMIMGRGFVCKPYRENTIHPIFCCEKVPYELNLAPGVPACELKSRGWNAPSVARAFPTHPVPLAFSRLLEIIKRL